jgi:hypothetical protein
MFFVPCFATPAPSRGHAASLDGWQALSTTRWVLLVTVAVSLALVVLTATRRAPAVPVAFAMFAFLTGDLASLMLLYRVVHHPGLSARAGIYIGLAAALAVAYGGYRSLRTEGGAFDDPGAIETVSVDRPAAGARGRRESSSTGRRESSSTGRSESSSTGRSESSSTGRSESSSTGRSESSSTGRSESAPAGRTGP